MKKKSIIKASAAVLCAALLLTSCAPNDDAQYTQTTYAMGVAMTVTVYGQSRETAADAVDAAFEEIARIEKLTSSKLADSELNRLNSAQSPLKVDEELAELLNYSLGYTKSTGGAFDITLGTLISLWGIGTQNERIPADEEIEQAMKSIGADNIIINGSTVALSNGVHIDLGAVAKGYAADKVKEVLSKNGVSRAIINLGGNIYAMGARGDDEPWNIGIIDPAGSGSVIATVSVKDKAVVTSGDYQRYFERDGVRYHHILDGKTGFPSQSGLTSVTVICENSALADILSTACFVLGEKEGMALIESIPEAEAVFISKALGITVSSGVNDNWFTTS